MQPGDLHEAIVPLALREELAIFDTFRRPAHNTLPLLQRLQRSTPFHTRTRSNRTWYGHSVCGLTCDEIRTGWKSAGGFVRRVPMMASAGEALANGVRSFRSIGTVVLPLEGDLPPPEGVPDPCDPDFNFVLRERAFDAEESTETIAGLLLRMLRGVRCGPLCIIHGLDHF